MGDGPHKEFENVIHATPNTSGLVFNSGDTSGLIVTSGANATFELQPLIGYDPFAGPSQDSRVTELLLENQDLKAEVERLRKELGKKDAIKDLRRIEKELR